MTAANAWAFFILIVFALAIIALIDWAEGKTGK